MLITTPYRSFEVRDKSPPRVVSEIKKNYGCVTPSRYKPRLNGDLLLKFGNEQNWWPRKVALKHGQLLVSVVHRDGNTTFVRLPLRHLSIQAASLPNSFSLCRGHNVVLSIQAPDGRTFGEWARTVAIEIIRQTPLSAIKYLDILTFQECWNNCEQICDKDWNFNDTIAVEQIENRQCDTCQRNENNPKLPTKNNSTSIVNDEEQYVEDLMKRCQNVENYVPVKDKLFLFETLCKLGRKVRSSEDVSVKVDNVNKRTRSLHDLTNISSHVAVREICKYFEKKTENDEKNNNNRECVSFKPRRINFTELNDVNKKKENYNF